MSLRTYRQKRRFTKTPEPRGRRRPSAGGWSFTIQRHHASRLHYDFRLELDGVLKSWAVPKGPCLDPSVRRLAVEVEDHPVEYGTFEGAIPEGEYGAGTVVLWERGTWTPVDDPREGLRKGHLRFSVDGRKLRGRWDLVRLRGREGERGKTNWLLIKVDDEFARPLSEYDITEARPESVAGVAARRRRRVWHSDRAARKTSRPRTARRRTTAQEPPPQPQLLEGAKKAAMPQRVSAQLCTLTEEAPGGEEWVHEVKYDGYRILAKIDKDAIRLETRNGNDWTNNLSPISSSLAELGTRSAILDGEAVVLNEKGVSSFQRLQNLLSQAGRGELVYYVFDLLYLDGWDLRGCALSERKALLERLLRAAPENVRYSDHVRGRGPEFFAQACRHGLEGCVSKRADSPYAGARTKDWLKIKCLQRQEFVVCGFTEPSGSRSRFGALVLGFRDKKALRYAGRVGTGFSERTLEDVYRKLVPLERKSSPVKDPPKGANARGVRWVDPRLVAEVAFGEWTDEGIVRHPRFVGLREDKPAEDVVAEKPRPLITLTHEDRVLYPEQGITKRDLARYYEAVADRALPHLTRRPLALVRCPRGHGKHCFFQKHLTEAVPALHPVDIEENGVRRAYLYIDGLDGLLTLVQLGVLEIHPWGSRVETLEQPDVMTFDLDPHEAVPWQRMIEAARELRARLKEIGLRSFLKTTGGKGLHVVVPLRPSAGWDRVKAFSKSVVELMVREQPRLYTANMAKAKRPDKIFLDYLRNGRGATAVGAYSTRARPGAPVAAPLAWEELDLKLRPDRYTVRNMPARLRALRQDPWAGYFDVEQRIT